MLFDYVAVLGKALASATSAKTQAILMKIAGIGSTDPNDPNDVGEVAENVPAFSALGVVARPLQPETLRDGEAFAEVICLRRADGLIPVAWRDRRLSAIFPNGLKEGATALAGYGGGFVMLDMTPANSGTKKANILIGYCPYDYDANGVAQKAHALIMDPADESVSFIHGDGQCVLMKEDKLVLKNQAGDAYIEIGDDGIVFNGNIKVRGSLLVGTTIAGFPVALVGGPPNTPISGGPAAFMTSN